MPKKYLIKKGKDRKRKKGKKYNIINNVDEIKIVKNVDLRVF